MTEMSYRLRIKSSILPKRTQTAPKHVSQSGRLATNCTAKHTSASDEVRAELGACRVRDAFVRQSDAARFMQSRIVQRALPMHTS